MKKKLSTIIGMGIVVVSLNLSNTYAQTYNLVQTFESGGSGTDACWTGYNGTSIPSTNDFFTGTSVVQSGTVSGGMYSCCGGAVSNVPTYYISSAILNGTHTTQVYLRQSSFFAENFEIGTVSDNMGSNFTPALTVSTWPSVPAWQLVTTNITTNSVNNRIAFRVPSASLKTYYLDSIVITNTGNLAGGCNYITVGIDDANKEFNSLSIFPNPASTTLTIKNTMLKLQGIKIINLLGALVYQSSINKNQTTIDIANLEAGIYFVQVTDENKNVTNKKIIIE